MVQIAFCANLFQDAYSLRLIFYWRECQSADFKDLQESPIYRGIPVSLGLAQTDQRFSIHFGIADSHLVHQPVFNARWSAAYRPATFFLCHSKNKRPLHINGVALKCFPASAASRGSGAATASARAHSDRTDGLAGDGRTRHAEV